MSKAFDPHTINMRSLVLTAHRAFTEKIQKQCEDLERRSNGMADSAVPLTVQMENVQKTAFQRKTQAELAKARNIFGYVSEVPLEDFGPYLSAKRQVMVQAYMEALQGLNEAALRLVNAIDALGRDRASQNIIYQAGYIEAHRYILEQFDAHFGPVLEKLAD